MLNQSSQFHVGCVVWDIEQAQGALSRTVDLQWTPTEERVLDCRVPAGRRSYPIRFSYSLQPPHLELVERIPGSLWDSSTEFCIHHLGYWSEDLSGDFEALQEAGYACEYAGATDDHDGVVRGAYFRTPLGGLIELVDVALRPGFESSLASARP